MIQLLPAPGLVSAWRRRAEKRPFAPRAAVGAQTLMGQTTRTHLVHISEFLLVDAAILFQIQALEHPLQIVIVYPLLQPQSFPLLLRAQRSGCRGQEGERQAGGRKSSGENPEGSGQGVNKKRKCETAGDGGSIAGAKSDTVTRMRPRLLAAAQSCTTQDALRAGAHER